MRVARGVIITVTTITGACFAVLAGLSISAVAAPFRQVRLFSIVIAVVSICVGYFALRAATSGHTDTQTLHSALYRAMLGAFIGLAAMTAVLFLFRPDAQGFLAHSLGRPASTFTSSRLLVASAILGFGAGFVARIRRKRSA